MNATVVNKHAWRGVLGGEVKADNCIAYDAAARTSLAPRIRGVTERPRSAACAGMAGIAGISYPPLTAHPTPANLLPRDNLYAQGGLDFLSSKLLQSIARPLHSGIYSVTGL